MPASPRPTKAERQEEARAAALRLRQEQERAAKRQRTIAIALLAVAVVVIGAVVAFILSNQPDPPPSFSDVEEPLAEVTAPAAANDEGGIPVGPEGVAGETDGAAEDAVEVVVYSDFMCPICGQFEQLNGPVLDEMREAGEIVVDYRPVSILDRYAQGTEYSTRAATAAALVADRAPEEFHAFNTALFLNQPAENTAGWSDEEIAAFARDAGVPDDVVAQIEDGSYLEGEGSFRPWVAAATEVALRAYEQFGTPTIVVDGTNLNEAGVDWRQPGALEAAIEQARG